MPTILADADGNPPTIYRGTSFTFVFAVSDPTISPTSPKNLAGATEIKFAIARHRGATEHDLLLSLDDDSPVTVTHDGAGGNITVAGTPEMSEALPYGMRHCELWVTDAAGRRELVGEGACQVHDTLVNL